ncbi:CvpA family protein [Marinomonas rhizomae]|uniref:Membrane protein required for colicin V production n=1 Tax=Marinomonas rhizomae TaxID=491948 RepID=A0A366JCW6_9GAMM|nr:CvpA family protein [Marinomonas rhizomae]RBP84823.1 membrane protein required for colicin V production [Marinomonas rhizomae]RNF74982.1 CvpA family protein [Marinomonas rhizomae]
MEQVNSMSTIDWLIIAVVVLSTLLSLKRGFVKEVLSLLTWVVAFVVSVKFSDQMQVLLVDQVQNDQIRYIVSFVSLFIATLVVGVLVSFLLGSLIQVTGLTSTDRVLGMLFGFARGSLIVVAFVSLLSLSPAIEQTEFWKTSQLIPQLGQLNDWTRDMLGKSSDLVDSSLIDRALGN